MPRFDFQSPGAAFVDTLTRVMAERKAEERQQMLDRLTQAAEERANRESADRKAYQDAQIGNMKHGQGLEDARAARDAESHGLQADASRINLTAPTLDPTTPFTGSSIDPKAMDALKRYGHVTEAAPAAEAQEAPDDLPGIPARPAMFRYRGDAKYRDEQRLKQERLAAVRGIMNDPRIVERLGPEAGSMLTSMVESGADPTPLISQLTSHVLPGQEVVTYDQGTGKWGKGPVIKPGQSIVERSRAPLGPQRSNEESIVGATADGTPMVRGFDGKIVERKDLPKLFNKDQTDDPLGVPTALYDRLREAALYLAPGTNWLGAEVPPPADDIDKFRAAAVSVLQEARGISPRVRALILDYIENPELGATRYVQEMDALSPAEKQQYKRLRETLVPAGRVDYLKPKAPEQE